MTAALPTLPEVTAVIVSHNSGELLAACVADLLGQTIAIEVIVVDNASIDDSLRALPMSERVRVIRNPDNRGFGVACNQGAALAQASRLLFINPDCRLSPNALAQLIVLLDGRPSLGLLGADLRNADGSVQAAARRRTPIPLRAIRQILGREAKGGAVLSRANEHGESLDRVEATSGAFMLMPRAVFESLGGFDPAYVLHCEDLDLCRRVLHSGHEIAVANEVQVTHVKGTSSRRRPIWVEWQKHRGMLRYFRKFDAAGSPWWLRMLVPVGIAVHFSLAALRAWRR